MTNTYLLKLNNIDLVRNNWYTLLNVVSHEKFQHLERITNFDDAARSLIAEILLRSLIKQHLGISNDKILFLTGRYGKPYLAGAHENALHFNISHSGSWIAVSIGNCENGIDVQEIRDIRGASDPHTFFEEWVQREAKLKCLGVGILGKLEDADKLYCHSFSLEKQTKAAVCAVLDGFSEPQSVALETLLDIGGQIL
ncbi:MAG: hypothetical protein FWE92_06175 [Defluviitaleaceae bacterium]|nr:hypothetical protein [Defluviitaleaceae bacterium]